MRTARLIAIELLLSSAVCAVVAMAWVLLGSVATWCVSAAGSGFSILDGRAALLIAVPAFLVSWVMMIMRQVALRSRASFVGFVTAAALVGAVAHRAAFIDQHVWSTGTSSVLEQANVVFEASLARILWGDLTFLYPKRDCLDDCLIVDTAWLMNVLSVLAAPIFALVLYGPARRWLARTPGE